MAETNDAGPYHGNLTVDNPDACVDMGVVHRAPLEAEIARLRAELERVTEERNEWRDRANAEDAAACDEPQPIGTCRKCGVPVYYMTEGFCGGCDGR